MGRKIEDAFENISLIEKFSRNSPDDILESFSSDPVFVCDFYVDGAEEGRRERWGYRLGRIINIDHHAPTDEMATTVSSSPLVLEYLRVHGSVRTHDVVINHTDCDSILSSCMLSGILEPLPRYAEAALSADHRGDADPIADLLQAIEHERSIPFSLSCLSSLESGEALPERARDALDNRKRLREKAERVVKEGRFKQLGHVTYAILDERVDAELLLPLFPSAAVVMYAFPRHKEGGRYGMKVRLAQGAPTGLSLIKLGIQDFDPAFGGRWNAGSNDRGKGTDLNPDDYAKELNRRVSLAIADSMAG